MASTASVGGTLITDHFVAYTHGDDIRASHISPDGSFAVSSSQDGNVWVANTGSRQPRQNFLLSSDRPNAKRKWDVSVSSVSIATFSADQTSVSVWERPPKSSSRMNIMRKYCNGMHPEAIALTADGTYLCSVFKCGTSAQLFLTNVRQNSDFVSCQTSTDFHSLISPVNIRHVLFARKQDGNVVMMYIDMWDTVKNRTINNLVKIKVSSGAKTDPAFCTDDNASRVFIADHKCLRVWNRNNGSEISLPQFACAGSISVAATADGNIVVASVTGGCFGIWNVSSRIRIATLRGHRAHFSSWHFTNCAISHDGGTVVTTAGDRTLRVWTVPSELLLRDDHKPSPLQAAYASVLEKPSLLDMKFLLDNIISSHVQSASDLYAGHNLVLLAIRACIITRENISNFGGDRWYIHNNLFMPASKLVQESKTFICSIFAHAEKIGIIENGYMLKLANDIRFDLAKQVENLKRDIGNLSTRVQIVESQVYAMNQDMTKLHIWAGDLNSAVEGLQKAVQIQQKKQTNVESAIVNLAESLTSLQENLKERDQILRYAGVARCMLSLIPILGTAVGDVLYSAADVGLNMTMEDVVAVGADAAKGMVSSFAEVDLSNFKVAKLAFSEETLNRLTPPKQQAMKEAVAQSSFRTTVEIVAVLTEALKDNDYVGSAAEFVDISSSKWMCGTLPIRHEECHEREREKARLCFRFKTCAQEEENRMMSVEEAKVELQSLLEKNFDDIHLNSSKIEDIFFTLSPQDVDYVTEPLFVEMYSALYKEFQQKGRLAALLVAHAKRFRDRAQPTGSVTFRLAARIMGVLGNELKREGVITESDTWGEEELKFALNRFDKDGSNSIEEAEFIAATKELLHGFREDECEEVQDATGE